MESSTQPCASRVCYAFSETGKCEFGAQCPAFHIRWDYSSISRSLREPLCCALHNCFYSHEMIHKNCVPHVTNRHFILSLDNEQTANAGTPRAISVSPLHFSLTIGLGLLPSKENYCRFSQKRCICRLHLEGRCKWTKDCGRVHICRTLLAFLQCEEVISFLKASQSQNETSYSLYQRISQSNRIQAYIRSVVVLPLIKQFIDTSNTKVLMALIAGRCAATVEQALVLQGAGLLKQLSEVQVTPVSPLIQPLLIPKMFVVA
ncbi:hypothetical protein AGDE_12358 [Angomonas deanei]|uniref:C3H1-type domain-containing protein n=1 Tax=Angomonas deanei TaxID=59799 RepID=A0A7G2CJW8_9TRYP|nr:hypothetical protein AGDE_12358 [Angomonas deanei]CAD2220158.1 hypothetical protein, conserved [Angomonas deanei]|eukprot:EPY24416.1 hypothetical protein AGDE_12358 [Angomonas deanei]